MKIHEHSIPKYVSILMLAITLLLIRVGIAVAFANRLCTEFNPVCHGGPVHEAITMDGLSFLKPTVIEKISEQHSWVDVTHLEDSQWHFDDCEFSQSVENINEVYGQLLEDLNPNQANLVEAQEAFGTLLHPIQDFYSHSNWVETERTDLLIDSGLHLWMVPKAYELYSGVVIVQGESIPSGLTLARTGSIVAVTVTTPTQALAAGTYRGLISGSTYVADDCPDGDGTMSHADLNKDNDGRTNFPEAKSRAVLQTTHEWCRLVNMVNTTYPRTATSSGGLEFLFKHWVEPGQENAAISDCTDNVNVALLIDQTASMLSNDPAERRKEAAKAFVDSAQIGDKIAVVAFNTEYVTLAPLTTILSDTQRTSLKNAIDLVSNTGSTNLNSGLQGGFAALNADVDNQRSAAIFLTDGRQTDSAYNDQSHLQYQAKQWPIYTIGLGADTDPALLGRIAADTDGEYSALGDPNQLVYLYAQISQNVANGKLALTANLTMTQGSNQQLTVYVPAGQTAATFFTNWPGSDVRMQLHSPTTRQIDAATADWNVYHAKGSVYEVYTLHYPEPGLWTIDLYGVALAPAGEQVKVNVYTQGNQYIFLPVISHR